MYLLSENVGSRSSRVVLTSTIFLLLVTLIVFSMVLKPPISARAAFPGDNGKIAYVSTHDGDNDIYIVNPDGSSETKLTDNTRADRWPAWSPDGTRIAFSSDRQGGPDQIYVMKADGSRVTRLTQTAFEELTPNWSPDGSRIVFSSTRDLYAELYVMDANGGNQTRVTENTEEERFPVWSPDGSKIAYHRPVPGRYDQIFVIPATGGDETQVGDMDYGARNPNWSPDGSKIVFEGGTFDGPSDIFIMDASGSNVANVTNTPSINEYFPNWSPDGTKLTYTAYVGINTDIYTSDIDGSNVLRLTNHSRSDESSNWQPLVPVDQRIYVSTTAGGTTTSGLAYGVDDILKWDGAQWTTFYNGQSVGISNGNVNAFDLPDPTESDVYLNFTQSPLTVPGVGAVAAHDIVFYNGSTYSMIFDGSDEDLSTAGEKIDAFAVLDGALSPLGDHCKYYLLISTVSGGSVEDVNGQNLTFKGEDVLGFCQWHVGANTAGLWQMVLDGSTEGLPANSIVGISGTDDGLFIYLTTKGAFNTDGISGSASKIYGFDLVTRQFSGPFWDANAFGLRGTVDGLSLIGEFP